MSRVTDVLVAIDTATVLQNYRNPSMNPDAPTQIDTRYVYMITNQDNALAGQAGGELNLKAQVGDLIRWRETSLSLGFETAAIFYKFIGNVGNDLISTPTPRTAEASLPYPNQSKPSVPVCQKISNYFWSSETLKAGSVTYHFNFMVVDRSCKAQGFFSWDPYITITN